MPHTPAQHRMLAYLRLLGEPPRLYHLAGFALVLGGVVLTSRR